MGILEFVFGKSVPKDDTEGKQAYYLSDDDAKTFGNIDYMRSTKVVRRTFAKKKGQAEHMESVRQISATDAKSLDGVNAGYSAPTTTFASAAYQPPAPVSTPAAADSAPAAESTEAAPAPAPTPARRQSRAGDMDMFRNMAKDIRK